MKKNVAILLSNQSKNNPALFRIYNDLKDECNITIFGKEPIYLVPKEYHRSYIDVNSKYRILLKLRLIRFLFIFSRIFSNKTENLNVWAEKLSIAIAQKKINKQAKTRPIHSYIAFDPISHDYIKPYKLKNSVYGSYFIYEIYAEESLKNRAPLFQFKTILEREACIYCDLLISGGNDQLASYLNKFHKLNKPILEYSICPKQEFENKTQINNPIKFYYHGKFYPNRGIINAIKAIFDVENAQLYLRGDGPLEAEIKTLVETSKIKNKVFILDPIPMKSLAKHGVDYDIGLSLVRMNQVNHFYNLGFKTFENISSGLGLMSPKSYPLKKLINEYKNGICYSDATIEELKRCFNYLVENPKHVLKLKENSKIAYATNYNPNYQKQLLLAILKK